MWVRLENLDARTRGFMLEELEQDLARGKVYLSPRLSDRGRADYPALMREAIQTGTDETLAANLRLQGRMNRSEQRRLPRGGYTMADVPISAADTLAEGEFNRYYARGLCRRAVEDGIPEVIVYRAKVVTQPRTQSQAMLGKQLNAKALLDDLRSNQGVEPALGLPPGPNSGLSVRLP